jgi:hypothetical protein
MGAKTKTDIKKDERKQKKIKSSKKEIPNIGRKKKQKYSNLIGRKI